MPDDSAAQRPVARIRLANAPCSWGTLEFAGLTGERIPYERMLDELAATGYVGTELGDWGFMPTDPVRLKAELETRDLAMVGAFVQASFRDPRAHADVTARAVRTARLLSAVAERGPNTAPPFVILADDNGSDPARTRLAGRVTPDSGLRADEWRVFSRGVEMVARAVRDETGLPTAFHPHCAGFVETLDETARLAELTDPALVGLVLDTGHWTYGSGTNDPCAALDGLERFGDRVVHVHFKDCEPTVADHARLEGWDYFTAMRHGVFCELGRGCVDFAAVAERLRERGYRGWIVVEQDVLPGMGSPRESARRNRELLASLGL
ncbi:MAG: TIM barrel protein [Chloroflexi bacterium]|nr:TIM barrel protein [Chloroflexota bacterium]